jgi:hypothetical protein
MMDTRSMPLPNLHITRQLRSEGGRQQKPSPIAYSIFDVAPAFLRFILLLSLSLQHFAEPGDPEYEPTPPETRPPEPRIFRNPELSTQARVDIESKVEKCAAACLD